MIQYQIQALKKLLDEQGLKFTSVRDEYLIARYGEADLSIQRRPGYCDRGKWIWLATSNDIKALFIDGADGFPRYYFHDACLVKEIHAWLENRNLLVPQPEETP